MLSIETLTCIPYLFTNYNQYNFVVISSLINKDILTGYDPKPITSVKGTS